MKIKVEQVYNDEFGYYNGEGVIEFTKLNNGTITNYGRSLPF